MRLSGRSLVVILAIVGLVAVGATDQIVPATSEHQAQLRIWLAARAAGITAYLLLVAQVILGIVLSHPTAGERLKQGKRLFPWHENAWVFVLGFLAAHVAAVVADPWAGVGIGGAIVPGLSEYRTSAVALGTMALYALLVTGLTARYTRRLPAGWWLKVHRLALGIVVLAWLHGVLAGTDTAALLPMYLITGGLVLAAAAWRYWVVRGPRPLVVPHVTARGGSVRPDHVPPPAVPHRPTERTTGPIPVEVTIR